jgi:excisionase family DNA binding protein
MNFVRHRPLGMEMANMDAAAPITASIGEFCKLAGIGRSLVYEMIGDGRLDSIVIGKRRLIVLDSYRRLVERQRAATPPPRTKGKPRIAARP